MNKEFEETFVDFQYGRNFKFIFLLNAMRQQVTKNFDGSTD